MTATPDYTDFSNSAEINTRAVMMRPKVTDHFWGYEVTPNEMVISIATLFRGACGVLTVACGVASVGLWVMPADLFAGTPLAMKAVVSVLLPCLTFMAARVATRGTRISVQIETASGELREVVDGPFGTVHTLASYGLDVVDAVDNVSSRSEPSFGQVHVQIKDVGVISAADGAVLTLRPLRDRLASDCGIVEQDTARVAVCGGALAA